MRLSDHPPFRYLLREYEDVYRRGSAGGSKLIRRHQRRVRDTLGRHVERNPELRLPQPEEKPVCAHLPRALDNGARGSMASFVQSIRNVAPLLRWRFGYERMPKALDRKFAFAGFTGPEGPVVCPDLTLGIVLFAPTCVYPEHSHDGIEESYVSLSGACSENDVGVYGPGSLIFNPSGYSHRITIGDREPCLLAYAWIGTEDALAQPAMKFSKARGKAEKPDKTDKTDKPAKR